MGDKVAQSKKEENDLLLVKWIDAFHLDQGWMFGEADELEFDTSPVWTTGFLVKESKAGILLAQTWFPDDAANVIGIPRGMILDIIKLGRVLKENEFEISRENSPVANQR